MVEEAESTGTEAAAGAERHTRTAEAAGPESPFKPGYDHSWALVIGINNYPHMPKLSNCVNDASGIADLLVTQLGFDRERVFVILDPPLKDPSPHYDLASTEATKAVLESWLFTRLPDEVGPGLDDRVLIFFAGHGESRKLPGDRHKGYLVPSDGRPGRWHTFIEMDDVVEAGDYYKAKHIFYLVDACFSGLAVAKSGVESSRFEAGMLTAQARQALTAGTAKQTVADRGPAGHSIFTSYVLQGLGGDAAQEDTQVITASDLMLYVRKQVANQYGSKQTPDFGKLPGHESGGDFLFRLPPMGLTLQEHLRLGNHLFELGQLLNDPGRFVAAAEQYKVALDASRKDGHDLPEAHVGRGRSLLAAGRPQEAIDELAPLVESGAADEHPEARLHLGLAYSELGSRDRAAAALEAFARLAPEDERAPWAGEYATWLQKVQTGRRRALLIGINEYEDPAIQDLNGCVYDVQFMEELLREQFGFGEDDKIKRLEDKKATRQGILDEFARLADPKKTTAWDSVIVHFSGHSIPGMSEAYLLGYDAFAGSRSAWLQGQVLDSITARELHTLMNRIPTKHKTLILDTHPNTLFLRLAQEEAEYALMAASSTEVTGELKLERDGKKIAMGHFTWALLERLREVDPREVTYSQIIYPVMDLVQRYKPGQKPLFVGRRERRLFAEADDYATAFHFSQRRNYSAFSAREVSSRYGTVRDQLQGPFPAMHHSFGRAFLEHGHWEEALDALGRCIEERGSLEPELQLALATAQAGAQHYDEALVNFKEYAVAVPDASPEVDKILPVIEVLQQGRKAALLIGIDQYASPDISPLQGAANDVAALKEVLVARYGFSEKDKDTVVLLNGEASRERILGEFKRLAKSSLDRPALLFFSGYGSVDPEDRPTIVSADGRRPGISDIPLHSLAAAVSGKRANLTSVIDAGWTRSDSGTAGSRVLEVEDPRKRSGERFVVARRSEEKYSIHIGSASLYNWTIMTSGSSKRSGQEEELENPRDPKAVGFYGQMTHSLVRALWSSETTDLTYAQLINLMRNTHALGEELGQPVFSPVHGHRLVRAFAGWPERDRVRQMIALLRRTIKHRSDSNPEGHLSLGIALGYLKEYDQAIEALNKALAQKSPHSEAHYHLGRLLLERGKRPASAVDELRAALEDERADEKNMAARYYLGQALRAFVEQDVLVEAEKAFGEYLAGGAPLGQEEEVMAFLESRKAQR